MNTRNLIIIAIFVILVVILGIFAFTLPHDNSNSKINTEINFLSQDTLKNGEAVQFQLKDASGNALAHENITIKFEENGENQTYAIITDADGKGSLVLNNELPGTYNVHVSYNGTQTLNGCSASQTITVEEGIAQQASDDSDSQQSSQSEPIASNSSAGTSLYNGNSTASENLHYDSQYNFYYDDNGIIRGGQSDGMSADYLRNQYESGDMVDDEGNLQ